MSILPVLRVRTLLPLVIYGAVALPATADPFVTKAEAEAMVKKTVAYMKTNGRDKTYTEINRKDGPFTDRDLYITVYGTDGVVRAHGANLKMLNRNLMDIKDVDGKEFVRERIELAKKNAPFWQEYKFTNPLSKKTEPKAMYCQPHEDVVVCGGVYIR
ncbi:cache domain-containing protein [Massilia sp. CCM 9210]|uniref:cache domain-containing protein n=1 Tax=Massilia scottii TaxID=3057166 RepID=UPI0027967EFF|nr:cache domain-containing protein [Massilia sp. CCM 9210]MDQ1813204.1 cache domain-containing protein [Massilia sp. CCM 9210]